MYSALHKNTALSKIHQTLMSMKPRREKFLRGLKPYCCQKPQPETMPIPFAMSVKKVQVWKNARPMGILPRGIGEQREFIRGKPIEVLGGCLLAA
jgi:hypothetical protein